jgi:hypothetical protein
VDKMISPRDYARPRSAYIPVWNKIQFFLPLFSLYIRTSYTQPFVLPSSYAMTYSPPRPLFRRTRLRHPQPHHCLFTVAARLENIANSVYSNDVAFTDAGYPSTHVTSLTASAQNPYRNVQLQRWASSPPPPPPTAGSPPTAFASEAWPGYSQCFSGTTAPQELAHFRANSPAYTASTLHFPSSGPSHSQSTSSAFQTFPQPNFTLDNVGHRGHERSIRGWLDPSSTMGSRISTQSKLSRTTIAGMDSLPEATLSQPCNVLQTTVKFGVKSRRKVKTIISVLCEYCGLEYNRRTDLVRHWINTKCKSQILRQSYPYYRMTNNSKSPCPTFYVDEDKWVEHVQNKHQGAGYTLQYYTLDDQRRLLAGHMDAQDIESYMEERNRRREEKRKQLNCE